MEFKDLKPGDTVYIEKDVSFGWNAAKTFIVPVKVERITPTQIIVEGNRYKKTTGRLISKSWTLNCIKLDGIDQSAEMKAFDSFLKLIRSTKNMLESVKITIETPIEKVQALKKALEEFNI